ncbi:MAG TPA: YcaO-like family protein [Candidatus Nanoarchaeia archaeon]|nr:YcaO-like family protein [Candidatus Nanoarchaeia archaeon]
MTGLDEVVRRLEDLHLCSEIQEMILFTDEPKLPGYFCVPDEGFNVEENKIFGQGLSTNKDHAKTKAIAECVERMCLFHPRAEFHRGKFVDSQKQVDPFSLVPFSDEQVNLKDYQNRVRNAEYKWVKSFDHINAAEILVPGQVIYLSQDFENEPVLREQISTGAALHSDRESALVSGTLEIIERDAYITAYLRKKNLKKIKYEGCGGELVKLTKYLQRYALEPSSFDLTSDLGIPTAMTITLDRTGIGPAVNIGLRSGFTIEDAIFGSMLESIQCRRTTRIIKSTKYAGRKIRSDELSTINNRYFYWYDLERISDLNFWLSSDDYIERGDLNDVPTQHRNFEYLKTLMRERGYNLLSSDITWPEIKKAGFLVYKVVVPELHPLYLNEAMKCLFSVHGGKIKEDTSLKPHPFT